jgi:hypothetical protein
MHAAAHPEARDHKRDDAFLSKKTQLWVKQQVLLL